MTHKNLCKCCQTATKNPSFCSKACAAKINNKVPKRKRKIYFCTICGTECKHRRKFCKDCFDEQHLIDYTLDEAIYHEQHRASAFSLVRTRARKSNKVKNIHKCEHCGYDKHVEVCHIKPISSFPLDTKISEINADTNLLILCPNCHWEFDNIKTQTEHP